MNNSRITRSLAKSSEELRREIEAFDPFICNRSIPRGDSEEEINNSVKQKPKPEAFKKTFCTPKASTSGVTMAVQPIPLKDALTVVPEFNGENTPLSVFLEGCDEAKEMVTAENEANLVKLIRSKLTGEARKAIYGQAFGTIEELKDFIKAIYAPSKTVHQLLGEMGSDYQREHETVISFANRIKDLGRRIIETQRVNTGNIDAAFRTSITNNSIECFKRGLKPEVEQRLENADDMEHIVQNAIKAERLVEARRVLRKEGSEQVGNLPQNKAIRRGTYVSQVFHAERTPEARDSFNMRFSITCQICSKVGHTANTRRDRLSRVSLAQLVCQICNKEGHAANRCEVSIKCQICDKLGHSAKQCRSQNIRVENCQICGKAGHIASRCFQVKPPIDRGNFQLEARSQLNCQLCKRTGHTAATCRVNTNKTCAYCQNSGHTIEDCRKRKYNERMKSGNGEGLRNTSAGLETQKYQMRSTNYLQTEEPTCELLPLD